MQAQAKYLKQAGFVVIPSVLALSIALTGCGGSTNSGSSASTKPNASTQVHGAVFDGPVSNAAVNFTTGAPFGQPGAVLLGTVTSDASANFTINISVPNSAVPVFANAVSPDSTVVLSSYLGAANTLSTAGVLDTHKLPNLEISQVTTAALAIYKAQGGNYANLTPSLYKDLIARHHDDILPLAASIQAIADGYCAKPGQYNDTESMAEDIAKSSTLSGNAGNSTVLKTASSRMGASCTQALQNLQQSIASDKNWAPELDLGDVSETSDQAVAAGSYSLQGIIAETGLTENSPASTPTGKIAAPEIFTDATITVSSTGDVSSTDAMVTGTVEGNFLELSIKDKNGNTYNVTGKAGVLSNGASGGSSAYALRSGGENSSSHVLTRFDAVLAPATAQANWATLGSSLQTEDGPSCTNGFGVHLEGAGSQLGGLELGLCIAPTASGFSVSQSADSFGSEDAFQRPEFSAINIPSFTMTASTATPFIVSATVSLPTANTPNGVSGTVYYVMGSQDFFYSVDSLGLSGVLTMNECPLDTVAENTTGSDH